MPKPEQKSGRTSTRVDFSSPVAIATAYEEAFGDDHFQTVVPLEISETGISFSTGSKPETNELVLRMGDDPRYLKARVVRCQKTNSQYVVGCEFIGMA